MVGVEVAGDPWLQRRVLERPWSKARGMCFVWKEALFLCLTLAILTKRIASSEEFAGSKLNMLA